MNKLLFALDRTAVLFIGIVAGAVVGISFFSHGAGPSGGGDAKTVLTAPTPIGSSPTANTPAPTVSDGLAPQLASAVREGRTIRIGVFGDSFGDGVWAGLYNILRGDSHYEVKQFSERSTGFTRYRSLNLLDDFSAKLAANPIDIAVISYGANDTQGIYLDGHGYAYMSEGWQRIVTERVTAIVNLLRQRGIQVYWVGLPKMREPQFDTDIRAMNAFYVSRMQALGVPYIETASLSTGPGGAFSAYLTDPRTHEQFNARTNDGIHMTIPGYILVIRQLSDRIRRSVAQAGGPAAPQPAAPRPANRSADSNRPGPAREASNDADRPRGRSRDNDRNDRDTRSDREREAPAQGTREARSTR
ncbi:DUF459 domain-containing protein [Allosphingosinicella sp.]|uniref:SGNH/GDSL hydrolase family protein n=1 Tax=Allosphingosinicella sp. TaxID=2823234 RepID=UPI00378365C3